ncbi:MAG: carboxypeptidase-like regulatory domain-containing protein, partial [Anaerolineae bacterium]|nr:carboxypeptidase-like regulatory domain-containing protein [Anaerolineae bacterium]
MSKSSVAVVVGVLLVLCGFTAALVSGQADLVPLPPTISGTVSGTDGPLADAIVQIKGTPNITQTAEDGTFTLSGIEGEPPVVVTAWSQGYYVGWA